MCTQQPIILIPDGEEGDDEEEGDAGLDQEIDQLENEIDQELQ